jgi:hypothetical protein
MAFGNHYPDPDVQHGAFKVLPRTDGGFVVVDTRRKLGKRTVGEKYRTLEAAAADAKKWHEEGHG